MKFIILPLTYKGIENKNNSIKSVINMASQIIDEEIKIFILSGIAVFTDKVIIPEYAEEITAEEIRRLISMTKVGKLFEDEKQKCIKEEKLRMLIEAVENGTLTEKQAAATMKCTCEDFLKMKDSLLQLV